MTEQPTNNKTIAKNTAYLYVRMLFSMLVSLYTSRVILQVMGVDDYGIYQAVGGVVGFLSFLKSALSSGTSRFLTFELGVGIFEKLKKTFNTTLSVHIILALIVAIISETVGLWFVYNKLTIPEVRFNAAMIAYHLSIVSAVLTIVQIPYNASIISHEKMSVFAYIGIFEVVAKLGIVYLLGVAPLDKLVVYSILLLLVHVLVLGIYVLYSLKNFKECRFSFKIDVPIFKNIIGFSGWSLLSGGVGALNSQGILVLLNNYFSPSIVVARSISIQVNMAATQFVDNFRTAVNPQVVKKLAVNDVQGSHTLLLQSTKFSYYLMFLLGLPIIFVAKPLLTVWLVEVPEYSVIFLQLIIIQSLFQVFDTSFYTALYAKGRIKENAIISPLISFLRFPIIYLLFKVGYSPVALSWAGIITYAFLGLIVKPSLIVKIADYKWKDIFSVIKVCVFVTIASLPLPFLMSFLLDVDESILHALIMIFVCVASVGVSVWFIGLTPGMKDLIYGFVNRFISIKK